MKNIGLIVNPLAGMGGPAGMKGSDRAECVIRARELGIKPIAYGRAEDVLVRLKSGDTAEFRLYTHLERWGRRKLNRRDTALWS